MSREQKIAQLRGLILDGDFNRGIMIEALVEGLPPEILGFAGAVKDYTREEIFELVEELWDANHDVNINVLIDSLQRRRNELDGENKDMAPLHEEEYQEGGKRRGTRKKKRRKRRRREKTNRRKTNRRRTKRRRKKRRRRK